MFSTKSLIEAVTTTSLEVQSSSPVDVHITSLLLLPQVKHCFQLLLSFIPCVEFLFTYESDFLVSVRAHQSQAQAWEQCVGIVPSSKHLSGNLAACEFEPKTIRTQVRLHNHPATLFPSTISCASISSFSSLHSSFNAVSSCPVLSSR